MLVLSLVEKMGNIRAPVLVIHGTADWVVPINNGIELYQAAPHAVEPCWISGAGHNDIILYPEYYDRLGKFLYELDPPPKNPPLVLFLALLES